MSNIDRITAIEQALREALTPTSLQVRDDSHLHAGHAGARSGKGHFHVTLRSPAFQGMTAIERHRAVFAALGDLMETDIHALSMDLAPSAPHA